MSSDVFSNIVQRSSLENAVEAVVQMYQENKEIVLLTVGKPNTILAHAIYLNMKLDVVFSNPLQTGLTKLNRQEAQKLQVTPPQVIEQFTDDNGEVQFITNQGIISQLKYESKWKNK